MITALLSFSGLSKFKTQGTSRVLGDGIWVAMGQGLAALGTLVGIRFVTEIAPPDVFGMVSLLLGITILGTNLFCTPLLTAAIRFYPELNREGKLPELRAFLGKRLSVTSSILICLLLFGGAIHSWLTGFNFWTYPLLAALLRVEIQRTIEINLFNAARRHRPYAIWTALEAWLRPALALAALVFFKINAQMILLGYVVATAAGVLIFRSCVEREGTQCEREPLSPQWRSEIGHYVLPLIPLAVVGWIATLSDRYVIGSVLGLEKVGIYVAIYGLVSRPFLLTGSIFLTTLRPVYFDAVVKGDDARAQAVLRSWLSSLGAVFIGGIILVLLLSDWITGLLLAAPYRSGAHLMVWIGLGMAFLCTSHVYNTISLAHRRSSFVLWSEGSGAAAALLFGLPMAWRFGLRGAALAVPVSFFIQLLTAVWLSRRFCKEARCSKSQNEGIALC